MDAAYCTRPDGRAYIAPQTHQLYFRGKAVREERVEGCWLR